MRKDIGYFEGTDSTLLTALVCGGYDTIPVSNGYDNHGRHVQLINQENKPDLLIGYVHKVFAPDNGDPNYTTYQEIFHTCRIYGVPLLLEVPLELQEKARGLFGDVPDVVQFVDPADMLKVAVGILGEPRT
ncbi:MAG: hypothetical protein OEM81_06075 [Acidimicrobiia bacterium]|nr:hypothetical protein [Acidimicrobiia bacterium]MDH3397387.1 hypothetical protein [Acidimicrobiia bacterium]